MREVLRNAFFVVADSSKARETVKNICKTHRETVLRRFGRAVVFAPTEFGAFLAFWLRAKHGEAVQIVRTAPVDEHHRRYRRAREASLAFAGRDNDRTPYPKFAAGTDHPSADAMRKRTILYDR
ncbi:hypothetical protein [Natrononativus amylolyticus]|uniref:DUF7855 family protein n=1 Tax=Natrononativus amylolyticus TaxID=2963434 RepID=UPI0020CD219C|nr:hypothetical protein [Natrononativus amylolyticus]